MCTTWFCMLTFSEMGTTHFLGAVFGGHCFRYFVIYIGKWAILNLYTQIECLWVSKFDWNCPKCFKFLIIDTQSTNLFLFKAFRDHFQFTEEKDMQFFEKIDDFGHFSGPFRLRNEQIFFYTLNNDTNSPAHLVSP